MTISPLRSAMYLTLGLVVGMGAGALASSNPGWVVQHPGTILLVLLGLATAAAAMVQRRMNRFERGHEQRSDAFRLAMLAQYAPELLERELAAGAGRPDLRPAVVGTPT